MATTFTLGSIEFFGTEVPEQLQGLSGRQSLAIHEFPGGIRTGQTFGAFPTVIRWKGVLTGNMALLRALQIDQIRVAGTPVPLVFGPYSFLGYVTRFVPRVRHEWLIPYDVEFEPLIDQGGGANPVTSTLTPEYTLNSQMNSLEGLQQGISGLLLPSALSGPVGALLGVTSTAFAASPTGLVSGIAPADVTSILSAVSVVQSTAAPFIGGTDATLASPAQSANNAAVAIGTTVASTTTAPRWVINTVNPNLFSLSAQYYNDASQWRVIATANGLTTPLPTGSFQLNIPSPP